MDSFAEIDVRVRVKGGGHVSQVYAIRQAIAKALVAYYAKNVDAASAFELKKKYIDYDRTLLIADPRRMEPKKFGGRGARARRQKRYVCSHLQRKHGPLISPQTVTVNHSCTISCVWLSYSLCIHVITMSKYAYIKH